jgi:putative ABC transport system permease protein
MIDLDSWQEVFATLRKNRLRTALTGLGVFLGILILMVMVAFNRSLEAGIMRQMAGFATNAVYIWAQRTSEPYAGLPPNRPIQFDNADVAAIARLDGIEHLAPRNQIGGWMRGAVVSYAGPDGRKTGTFQVSGDVPAVQYIDIPIMRQGRFINEIDVAEKRKVAVIGEGVVEQLFPEGASAIGQAIEISGVYFQVVGVFGTAASGQQRDRKLNSLNVPFSTFQQAFNVGDKVAWLSVTGKPQVSAEELEREVKEILKRRHKVAPTDDMAIGSWNAGKQFGKMNSLFEVMNWVMWFAGVMTLGAGVIGVVNIMLISVRERTKEIGVRKALGATPAAIVRMIVSEALVLTVIAGYLGIVAGVAAIEGWSSLIPLLGEQAPFGPPNVGLGLAVSAAAVIAVFGGLAGVIPAAHAARVQPIEALRTE